MTGTFMDAFSALSANLAPSAPSPSTNVASSSSSTKPFASHLQSATKQQRAGQRSEASASTADAQTGQATDAVANQPLPSQDEQANFEPAATDNSANTTDATATAGAMNATPPALPAQPAHGEAHATTSTSTAVGTASTGTAMTRLLDAITAPTPTTSKVQPEESKSTPASTSTSTLTPQTTATVTAAVQQIAGENTAFSAVPSLVTPSLAGITEPLPTSSPTVLPTTPPVAQLPGQESISQDSLVTQSPTIVVQSAAEAQTAATVANGQSSLPQSEVAPNAPLVVQNQYGQIITIQQNTAQPVAAEAQTAAQVAPFAGTAEADMDLNNQYIHSHLPNETGTKGEDSGNRSAMNNDSGQSMPQHQTAQQAEPPAATEPILAAKTLTSTGQESQPLIFSHQQSSGLTSAPLSTSTTTAEGSLYRLASGNTVPATAVIDQMITHFSINKRLESGTINLRLHPQELGELRMEIKVEQDNVKAHIVAQSPHAQEMIDRHLPKLREALEQQGLHLGQVDVTVAANDNATGEAFQENTAWQQSQRSQGNKQNQAVFSLEGFDEEPDTTVEIDNNLSVIA